MLKDEIELVITEYNSLLKRLHYNYELFDIYEGNLLEYLLRDIRSQMSEESFKTIEPRVAPINFLKKIIDKLSQIYSDTPRRSLLIENSDDVKMFDIYQKMISIDVEMQLANEIFNLEKYVMVRPYVDSGVPALRIMQPDKFFVMSLDKMNPTKVTHYIEIAEKSNEGDILHVYTDEEFLIIDSKGEIKSDLMSIYGSDGTNPVGKIPAIYISRSKFDTIPRPDTDLLKMTKMIPILFSDLNDVVFWQSFSIIYGIDLSAENLKMSPSAFWALQSDPTKNTKPEVGSIKPQADIEAVMNFIMFELQSWLSSRGIKASGIDQGNAQVSASGLSKIVDELDTSEDRKKQIPFFRKGETELWNLIFNHLHPYWVRNKMISFNKLFAPNQNAIIDFMEQHPIVDTSKLIGELTEEIKWGLTTRKKAIMKLNRGMTEKEAEIYIKEIDEESTIDVMEDKKELDNNGMDENKNQNTDKA